MKKYDAYLFGMVLATNSFLLSSSYPEPDTYGEIKTRYRLPGGETGSCATVLNSLGCSVIMDGNHIGREVYPLINRFYSDKNVDISPLFFDGNYDGLEDYVIIDKNTRTPFGMFGSYYSDPVKRWNMPERKDIISASVAGIDPFFGEASETAARICNEDNVPYVTIDCDADGILAEYASVIAVSTEYLNNNNLADVPTEKLIEKYFDNTDALVIFTRGSKDIVYGRKSSGIKTLSPYKVNVVSTLGAGDTFKAGCVYALLKGMSDDDTVRFASALAAVACTRFPLPLYPPQLDETIRLINEQK